MLPDSQERAERQLALLKKQIAQRKKAEEALSRESAIVTLLLEVAVAANEAKTTEAAFQVALDKVCAFTGWPLGRVFRVDGGSGELVLTSIQSCSDVDQYRPFTERTAATLSTANSEWLARVLTTGEPAWIKDVGRTPGFIGDHSLEETGIKSGFAFPVLADVLAEKEVVAVLEFFSLDEVEPDEELLEVMAHVGSQLGRVVERVRAERTMRESERRLRESEALLSEAERIARLGSWEWNVEEDSVSWSEGMCRVYGVEPGAFSGSFEGFLERVHADDRHYTRAVVGNAYENGESFDFFHRIVRPDGEVRLVHGRGKPVLDEAGDVVRMVGTGQDVTEWKQTEVELEQTTQQLAALNELGQTITASLDLEDVFQRVLGSLRPLLRAEAIFILLLEEENLVFAATNEIGMGSLEGQRVPVTGGVAGEVIDTGRPVWVYGDETRRRVYRHIEEETGYRPAALLATPLRLRGEWIGVMEAVHSEADAFDAGDLRLLEAAAAWTAIAIGNARLFAAQQRARRTAEVMRNANQDLTQTLDLDSVLETLLEHLQQLIGYDRAAVIWRGRGRRLRVRAARGRDAEQILHKEIEIDAHPLVQRLLSEQDGVLVADADEERTSQLLPELSDGVASRLGVPLRRNGEVVGICVLEKRERGSFDHQDELLVESLVSQASIALQNAQFFAEVSSGRERLRYLTGKVVSAQEEERRRVSRELHDQAGQALTALKMALSNVKADLPQGLEESRQELAEAVSLTDQTMQRIRLLAHDLRPPALDALSLNASLQGLCEEVAGRCHLSVTYRGAETASLPDAAAISFYRFLQEALTNVVKHADANGVEVVLEVDDGTVTLSVTDDGQGFVASEGVSAGNGIGLIGVQERFELLGGRLKIDSEPGRGTRLTASVPLEPT